MEIRDWIRPVRTSMVFCELRGRQLLLNSQRHQQFVTSSSVEEYYNDETAVLYALIKILPVDVRWGNPFAFSESSLYFNDLFIREPANNLVDWTAENFLEILCGVFHGNEEVEVENVYLHLFFAKMFDCPEDNMYHRDPQHVVNI
ncbi:hypothetical protein L3Y34_013404 [Caenorhabditis briggsae]|uniref:Uncharacterized protein n=1 Tax=Caenorhabditis briggsae TaxID=6238 RepID=A0AAE9CXJ7_CAEBR|nr:hypothetical protein L3Y34_013404 [Caenorhabditis briggsae]